MECVTRNVNEINRIMDSIPEEEWMDLDDGLRQVAQPYKPGLYHVRPRVLEPGSEDSGT